MCSSAIARLFIAVILALPAMPAVAHVTLERREAAIGGPYKAVFTVPHGCDGSATVQLKVQIPEGVIAVKPMAKPGWQIEVVRGSYAKAYSSLHGAKFTEGVKEVVWTGKLPDAFFDEFVLATFISSDLPAGGTLYFPVIQTCEQGEHRWVEVPTKDQSEHLAEPAPGVKLMPRN